MRLYVLDTDVCGFVQEKHSTVMHHILSLRDDDEVVTTIITFGEDLGGWLTPCRRARNGAMRVTAYTRLRRGLDFYCDKDCLPFDEATAGIFDQLRALKIRIGTNDLAIAAIVLSVNGVLVTRNLTDFQKIPGLVLEDWTR